MAPSIYQGAALTLSLIAAVRGGPLQATIDFQLSGFSLIPPSTTDAFVLPGLPTQSTTPIVAPSVSTPTPSPASSSSSVSASQASACPAQPYFHSTPDDWNKANTDAWLQNWMAANNGSFATQGGLVSTLGSQYLRQPDLACSMVSSSTDCTFDPCSIRVPDNAVDSNVQAPYYVLESIRRLHSYFSGLAETMQSSAIGAALSEQYWAYTFYTDKDDKDMTMFKEIANALIVVVALAAAMAGPIGVGLAMAEGSVLVAGGIAGGTSILFSGVSFGVILSIPVHSNNTPQKAAQIGSFLANMFTSNMQAFLQANAALMAGKTWGNTGDLSKFIQRGQWVDYPGMNESSVLTSWNNLLTGAAINQLYRLQKVFIVGGGPCDDSGGIGTGPQEAKFCRDGKAWYLYYWKEKKSSIVFGKAQWGHVDAPPGASEFGKGAYQDINPQAIINSSINAFFAAGGNNYTSSFAVDRAQSAINEGWADPISAGLHWEGIFTIPVCDVSGVVAQPKWRKKTSIHQPYGKYKLLQFCGPVCGQSQNETETFVQLANMRNFGSITHYC